MVKGHAPQAYRNTKMTREHISFTLDPSDMLLSLKMGFGFLRAAVAYAILKRVSGFEPSSETIASRYLKPVTVPSFCCFNLYLLYLSLDAIGGTCHQSGLLGTDRNLIPYADFVETFY